MTKALNPIRTLAISGGLAAAAVFAAQPAIAQSDDDAAEAVEMTEGEERLAKLLEGREAGEPQRCIRQLPNSRMETIDGTAYVYGRGNTIYVQRTRNPDRIDRHDALVTRRFNSTQLCRMDVMRTIDPVSGIFSGAVFFEDFVPYTKVDQEDAG